MRFRSTTLSLRTTTCDALIVTSEWLQVELSWVEWSRGSIVAVLVITHLCGCCSSQRARRLSSSCSICVPTTSTRRLAQWSTPACWTNMAATRTTALSCHFEITRELTRLHIVYLTLMLWNIDFVWFWSLDLNRYNGYVNNCCIISFWCIMWVDMLMNTVKLRLYCILTLKLNKNRGFKDDCTMVPLTMRYHVRSHTYAIELSECEECQAVMRICVHWYQSAIRWHALMLFNMLFFISWLSIWTS